MPFHWTYFVDCYSILCAAVPGLSAFAGSLIALKQEDAGRYEYTLLLANTAVSIPFGLASNLLYKFGGGFDRIDTKMAFGLYGATAFTGFCLLPVLRAKKAKAVTANVAVLAGLSVVTTAVFYNIDHTSAYLTIPFTVWATSILVFSSFVCDRSFGFLEIRRATDGNGAEIVQFIGNGDVERRLSILQKPLPDNVVGFESLVIRYIDPSAIKFLQSIRRLFKSKGINLSIDTEVNQKRSWQIIWHRIWPLINDDVCGISLYSSELENLRQFSPTVLRNCAKLRWIFSFDLFFQFPADDSADASPSQALAKWLHTPRGDGLPKVLKCVYRLTGVDGLKLAFVNSTDSVNFIIVLFDRIGIVPFELKNNLTREQLVLRRFDKSDWLLVRCPIERDEEKWAKWEREEIVRYLWRWNRISIDFNDTGIGKGLLEANEGPE